jgi:hypothetical protein
MDIDRWLHQPYLDHDFPLALDAPFTTRAAVSAGLPRAWLTRLTAAGLLRHPIKGCWVPTQVPDHIGTRAACLRLVTPDDAVVVDRHAGWLHGASMVLLPNEHLHLMPLTLFLPAGRGRLRNALCDSGERTLEPRDVEELHGLRVTTPLRTALDLGRQRWPEPALTALDALHRLGRFTVAELVVESARMRGSRWVTTLRSVAPLTDGRSQSGGETVIRWRWLHLPVPPPEPQVEVSLPGRLAFIDVGNAALRGGVEYKGAEWHTGEEQEKDDEQRERWLDREGDWEVRGLWCEQVYGHHAIVDRVIMETCAAAAARTRRRTA